MRVLRILPLECCTCTCPFIVDTPCVCVDEYMVIENPWRKKHSRKLFCNGSMYLKCVEMFVSIHVTSPTSGFHVARTKVLFPNHSYILILKC